MFFIPAKRTVQAIVESTPHVLGDDMPPETFPSSDVLFTIGKYTVPVSSKFMVFVHMKSKFILWCTLYTTSSMKCSEL